MDDGTSQHIALICLDWWVTGHRQRPFPCLQRTSESEKPWCWFSKNPGQRVWVKRKKRGIDLSSQFRL